MAIISETSRLQLRPLSMDDIPVLTDILSDPDVMAYSVRGIYDEASVRRFVEWCLSCYETHGIGAWGLIEKETSSLIGFCGTAPELVESQEEINLGYRLARAYWGKGLATEAVWASLSYLFSLERYDAIIVIVERDHLASLRVAEKAGFRNFTEGKFHGKSVVLSRMTSEQWFVQNAMSIE